MYLAIASTLLASAGAFLFYVSRPRTTGKLPSMYRAAQLIQRFDDPHLSALRKSPKSTASRHFRVHELPVPPVPPNHVLVRVERAPINPSDTGPLSKSDTDVPSRLGLECSGVVVATGGGLMGVLGWLNLGKRVACSMPEPCTYAEYVLVKAMNCIALPDSVSFEEGSSSVVNPLTALSFMELVQAHGERVLLLTAAASALGKMTVRLAHGHGMTVVAVVRREAQREQLVELGVQPENVVITGDDHEAWQAELTQVCERVQCKLAFECIAGEMTGRVLACLPPHSTMYVYGNLSHEPLTGIDSDLIVHDGRSIRGYYLGNYVETKNLLGLLRWTRLVPKLLTTTLHTNVRRSYPLEQLGEAIADALTDRSSKVCIAPSMSE